MDAGSIVYALDKCSRLYFTIVGGLYRSVSAFNCSRVQIQPSEFSQV